VVGRWFGLVGKQIGRLIDGWVDKQIGMYIGRWGIGIGLFMFISNDL
jgi:hypothetical protein